VDRSGFLKVLTKKFYPVLRAEGFRGSGSTLRRIEEPVIHVFNFQGSSSSDRCYLNLGAHLSFLPPVGRHGVTPASIREYHCAFSDRIDPPAGQEFGWVYGLTPEEAALNVDFLVSEWHTQGQPFFRRYASYPESFLSLLNQTSPDDLNGRDALIYARIAIHLGRPDLAMTFSEAGLESAPETASILREELIGVLQDLKNRV
jgi:hypothetical protein